MISKVVIEQMGLSVNSKIRFILLLFLQFAPGGKGRKDGLSIYVPDTYLCMEVLE